MARGAHELTPRTCISGVASGERLVQKPGVCRMSLEFNLSLKHFRVFYFIRPRGCFRTQILVLVQRASVLRYIYFPPWKT